MYNFNLNTDKVKDSISANFSCSYSILFLLVHAVVVVYRQADCFHKHFLLVLELIRAGSKTTVVPLFRKILMIASTLSDL
jgi:hypothetical protein